MIKMAICPVPFKKAYVHIMAVTMLTIIHKSHCSLYLLIAINIATIATIVLNASINGRFPFKYWRIKV
jgi:hypothetical protein